MILHIEFVPSSDLFYSKDAKNQKSITIKMSLHVRSHTLPLPLFSLFHPLSIYLSFSSTFFLSPSFFLFILSLFLSFFFSLTFSLSSPPLSHLFPWHGCSLTPFFQSNKIWLYLFFTTHTKKLIIILKSWHYLLINQF